MVLPFRNKNASAAPAAPTSQKNGGVSFHGTSSDGSKKRRDPLPVTPHPKKKHRAATTTIEGVTMKTTADDEYGANYVSHNSDGMQQYGAEMETQVDDHDKENHHHQNVMETHHLEKGKSKEVMDSDAASDNAAAASGTREHDETPQGEEEEEEPNWDELALHDPASTDIPVFLQARQGKHEADKRFAAVLDEFDASFTAAKDSLLNIAVDFYNHLHDKMDSLESDIRHNLVSNHEARAIMQERLKTSAEEAQGLFAQLLRRVSQPFAAAAAQLQNEGYSGDETTETTGN